MWSAYVVALCPWQSALTRCRPRRDAMGRNRARAKWGHVRREVLAALETQAESALHIDIATRRGTAGALANASGALFGNLVQPSLARGKTRELDVVAQREGGRVVVETLGLREDG